MSVTHITYKIITEVIQKNERKASNVGLIIRGDIPDLGGLRTHTEDCHIIRPYLRGL